MARAESIRPIPWLEAFGRRDHPAQQSQAALLLLLGAQLRGDHHAVMARASALKRQRFVETVPARDATDFGIPRLRFTRPVRLETIAARVDQRYPGMVSEPGFPDLAGRLRKNPTLDSALELLHACLDHPDDLPRVAAAASYFRFSHEPARLLDVLVDGTRSEDRLARDVAAIALARSAPEHPRLSELTSSGETGAGGRPAHTSLLIHGTFARNDRWWQPSGDFHGYIRANVAADLYGAPDRFEWSGGYSDAARSLAAGDLQAWVANHNLGRPDLFTHSHGGSVAMLATQRGLPTGKLVLLSCPVHVHKYMPDFTRVRKVVSIRVRLDLVILADRGGQRFRHPRIDEHVLPIWFDHSATHDLNVWQQYNVPAML